DRPPQLPQPSVPDDRRAVPVGTRHRDGRGGLADHAGDHECEGVTMAFLFAIGVLLLAVSAGFLVRAIALTRIRTSAQLRQIDTYGFSANAPEASTALELPSPN